MKHVFFLVIFLIAIIQFYFVEGRIINAVWIHLKFYEYGGGEVIYLSFKSLCINFTITLLIFLAFYFCKESSKGASRWAPKASIYLSVFGWLQIFSLFVFGLAQIK